MTTSSPPKDIRTEYEKEYLLWKNWGTKGSFGNLDKPLDHYYSLQLRKTNVGHIRNVLEIGFGDGGFLAYAKSQEWNITGTESNKRLVEIARQEGFNAIHSDEFDELEDQYFDLVVAFDVLEHVKQEDLGRLLSSIHKKLTIGGALIARFPNGDSPFGLAHQHGDITHVTAIGSGKMVYFAKTCGFEIEFIGGEAEPILGDSVLHFLRMIIFIPVKACLEVVTRLLFFPSVKTAFYSSNMVVVLKKQQASPETDLLLCTSCRRAASRVDRNSERDRHPC